MDLGEQQHPVLEGVLVEVDLVVADHAPWWAEVLVAVGRDLVEGVLLQEVQDLAVEVLLVEQHGAA